MLDTALPPTHWARVHDAASHMLAEVGLYQGRAPQVPADAGPTELARWLAAIPPIRKRDLRRAFPKGLVRHDADFKAALASGEIEIIATSGTTDDRLQVIWDQAWWDRQERDAMRLNAHVAEAMTDGYREAVLTTPVCGGVTCHVGSSSMEERTLDEILFLNETPDPTHWSRVERERMRDEWRRFAPVGVEADPAYLAALSRDLGDDERERLPAAFVTLTYELATRAHRRQIARGVDAAVYDLYGSTEAGVLFMGCTHGRLHLNAEHVHVDLEPVADGLARVIVTTIDRTWMPLLRYDTEDLVRTSESSTCACGRAGLTVDRIEGRADDTVEVDGRPITAAMLDDALDRPGLIAWQLRLSSSDPTLAFVGDERAGTSAAADASALLEQKVVARREAIAPEGSGKYRLIKTISW